MKVKWGTLWGVCILLLAMVQEVQAVAFKCHNQTKLQFRMRVHDRGEWRPWAKMPSGYWECPARSVKRTEHAVEIDVRLGNRSSTGPEWTPFYRGYHGSRAFTRIIHLYQDDKDHIVMTWYDEPPKCRDKPVWDGRRTHDGCLAKSGWTKSLLRKLTKTAVRDIAIAGIKAVFAGG